MNIKDLLDPEKMAELDKKFDKKVKKDKGGIVVIENDLELNNLGHNEVTEGFEDSPHLDK